MYESGHYLEAYSKTKLIIESLDSELFMLKFMYTKAKLERKLRLLTEADQTCKKLTSYNIELSIGSKFIFKAAYLRAMMLAGCLEFQIAK